MSRDTDLCPTGLLIGADTFWGKYTIVERVKRYQDIKKEWDSMSRCIFIRVATLRCAPWFAPIHDNRQPPTCVQQQ
jgi:hypothetical protein